MDDYVRALLMGQFSEEEKQPEALSSNLEEQERLRGEAVAKTLDGSALTKTRRRTETVWEQTEEARITALEETAGKRFLRRLEREIASLETPERGAVIFRQQETQAEGENREEVRIVRQMTGGLTPEGLSRVFQRDARRFH